MKKIGVYVHIPFCGSKCRYCDFLSFVPSPGGTGSPGGTESSDETGSSDETESSDGTESFNESAAYADALAQEILRAELSEYIIETIFIGGGTPSFLPPLLLSRILGAVRRLNIARDAEFTLEANPGSLDTEKLSLLKRFGVNRLSIGLQSADIHLLKTIGRAHTADDFYEAFHGARDAGFYNINVDVMFSLPGQTLNSLAETVLRVLELRPEHVSAYALTPEDGTPLKEDLVAKKISLPDEQTDREMYRYIKKTLAAGGYRHYEISNFARDGYLCRHNVSCWERGEYVGFGLGAQSFLNGERFGVTKDFKKYLTYGGDRSRLIEDVYRISETEALEETMFLGLRMLKGVTLTEQIEQVYGSQIKKLASSGLLTTEDGRIKFTERGLDLANVVFTEFIDVDNNCSTN